MATDRMGMWHRTAAPPPVDPRLPYIYPADQYDAFLSAANHDFGSVITPTDTWTVPNSNPAAPTFVSRVGSTSSRAGKYLRVNSTPIGSPASPMGGITVRGWDFVEIISFRLKLDENWPQRYVDSKPGSTPESNTPTWPVGSIALGGGDVLTPDGNVHYYDGVNRINRGSSGTVWAKKVELFLVETNRALWMKDVRACYIKEFTVEGNWIYEALNFSPIETAPTNVNPKFYVCGFEARGPVKTRINQPGVSGHAISGEDNHHGGDGCQTLRNIQLFADDIRFSEGHWHQGIWAAMVTNVAGVPPNGYSFNFNRVMFKKAHGYTVFGSFSNGAVPYLFTFNDVHVQRQAGQDGTGQAIWNPVFPYFTSRRIKAFNVDPADYNARYTAQPLDATGATPTLAAITKGAGVTSGQFNSTSVLDANGAHKATYPAPAGNVGVTTGSAIWDYDEEVAQGVAPDLTTWPAGLDTDGYSLANK